ncbi:MAG: cupredoxin family copper-binding protein [Gammaproteobacteria bacterium]
MRVNVSERAHRGLVLVCALAAAGATGGSAAQDTAREYTITIEAMRFEPDTLAVRRGDRVTWVNEDLVPHTATATTKVFDSGSIAPGGAWTHVAAEPGTQAYACAFHPTMKGEVVIR